MRKSNGTRIFVRLPLLLAILLLLGSCGKLELNQLSMVMAVGLDKEPTGKIRVTAQIVRPSDARGSTGAPSGGTGEPVHTVSAEGSSIFEAIRNLGRFSSRRIFWAHNRVIVVGEDLAKSDITDLLDFFTRNHELRMNTWIVVTPGKASELVDIQTGMEVVPGDSMDRLFRFSRIVAESPRTTIKEVGAAYLSHTSHPFIALVKKEKRLLDPEKKGPYPTEDQIVLSGTAVFNKGKMLGTLTPSESRGLMWFTERFESTVIALPCPDDPKKPVSLELRNSSFKVTPSFKNERVRFDIKLDVRLDLVELGCRAPQGTEEVAKELEEAASNKFKGDIEGALNKAIKVYKTDFLELGKVFQNRYPSLWKKTLKDWQDMFADAETKVEVKAEINNPVLLILPTRPQDNREEGRGQ
jgi:spore germination protein KC